MCDLTDIRQDIFDIKTVPKVLYIYRGDTFEFTLDLTISSSELNSVVLNCNGLPEAMQLTLLESTTTSSKWNLVLTKELTLILTPKNHNFTIMIVKTDGTELILYKGIMNVNNRVYSNYSNNYYVATLLKQAAPTAADNDYLIGTTWVNILTNRIYFLTSVVNDEANWLDYSDQLDALQNDTTNLKTANTLKDVNYDNISGVLTFTKYDDTTKEIDLKQSIVKVNQTSLTEVDLVYFMQTLEDGMYRIKTDLWGHEFLFVSDMNLPVDEDAEGEEEPILELRKEYARYTSNGTSYRYDFELNDWVMSAGGGPGGGGEVTTIQLTPVPLNFPLNFSHALGTDLLVTVNFTHSELEFATLRILRGTSEVEVRGVNLGENVIDLTPHIRAGSNSITLRVTDGERSRSISYNITGVTIDLSSTFNDALVYGSSVDIPFRVQTEAQRKVYFTVDGVTETITNVQLNNIKSLTGLTHGVKEVEIQAVAVIGDTEILSNKLRFNLIVSTQNAPPLISSKFEIIEVTRGSLISIDYIVYNPALEFNETILKVDGVTVGTLTVGRQRQFWNVKDRKSTRLNSSHVRIS